MARQNPDPRRQDRTQQTGRNRCIECGNNFATPDELSNHRKQTHPGSSRKESRNQENVPVE